MADLSRAAVHTLTNKPWSLRQCCDAYGSAGFGGISVWRNVVAPEEGGVGLAEAVKIVKGSGLTVAAYVRGGFFTAHDAADRRKAIDHNKVMINEARELGAAMVVLVVGATPGLPLAEARQQVSDGIAACLDHADQADVDLAIEPLHPMYAGDKSCVNRLAEARGICETLKHRRVGVALDVYHVWWDPDLDTEIDKLGEAGKIIGYHVCDWRNPTRDLLTDRGLMGDGCIDIHGITRKVHAAGFHGPCEVEVFSNDYWAMDQDAYVKLIAERFTKHV
jgi:sugar phosphate isomerase/epimerase